MKKLLLILSVILLTQCGPSAEEREAIRKGNGYNDYLVTLLNNKIDTVYNSYVLNERDTHLVFVNDFGGRTVYQGSEVRMYKAIHKGTNTVVITKVY